MHIIHAHTHTNKHRTKPGESGRGEAHRVCERATDLSIHMYMYCTLNGIYIYSIVHRYVNVCLALCVFLLNQGLSAVALARASRLRACLAALLTYLCQISINNDSKKDNNSNNKSKSNNNNSSNWHRHDAEYILHLHAQTYIIYTHRQGWGEPEAPRSMQ